MKILHIIAGCDRSEGGPIEGVFRLGEAFRELGHSQELMTLNHLGDPALDQAPVKIHAMGNPPPEGSGLAARFRRWARRSPAAVGWLRQHAHEYDAIIVDGLWNYATRAARLALPGGPTPYIVFPHGMLDPWFRRKYRFKHTAKSFLWQWNEGPLLRGARAAAFTTDRERELARNTWKPWGIREQVVGYGTAPPPPDCPAMYEAFHSAVPGLVQRPYLLFLGRLHEKKGCDDLIHAFGKFEEKIPFDLVIAGPGDAAYLKQLQAWAASIAPGVRIHWPGMLSGAEKWGAIYGCAAMVLPSHQENFGVVVAEALGCSRPVIITDQVNISDQVAGARAGIICADNPGALMAALKKFADMPLHCRDEMGARGNALFADQFDIKGVAKRLITIFEEPEASL